MKNNNRGLMSSCLSWIVSLFIALVIIIAGISYGVSHNLDVTSILGNTGKFLISGFKPKQSLNNAKNIVSNATNQASSAIDKQLSSKNLEQNEYHPFSFKGTRQFEMGNYDSLGRATYSHIQLRYGDKPTSDREGKITFNPVGWHNYKFTYIDENGTKKKAWLMNRGHLVGYLFSGINSEGKNLVPMTRYLNAGSINSNKLDSNNPYGMLFYEMALNTWLKENPNNYLDYYVIPNYRDSELIPRTVTLYWTGYNYNGKQVEVNLDNQGFSQSNGLISKVVLENVSANATINYKDGTATNTE